MVRLRMLAMFCGADAWLAPARIRRSGGPALSNFRSQDEEAGCVPSPVSSAGPDSTAQEGRLLPGFAVFAGTRAPGTVTVDLALGWALLPDGVTPVWAAQRLSMVRGSPGTCGPSTRPPGSRPLTCCLARMCRVSPYRYSDADIAALMTAARKLR